MGKNIIDVLIDYVQLKKVEEALFDAVDIKDALSVKLWDSTRLCIDKIEKDFFIKKGVHIREALCRNYAHIEQLLGIKHPDDDLAF